MNRIRKEKRNEHGFTLIEMLIVVAIIGVFLSLALPVYKDTVVNAQNQSCELNKRMLKVAMETYYLSNGNIYPATGKEIDELLAKHYLEERPRCSGKGAYTFTVSTDGKSVDVSCTVHHAP
ncbi:prepilin-type N-terminal cleavage/methylation domain-containing protein [Aneurinibacillus soli]|uniref:Fimbrial protein n=1 Tax=Aneurinibacillus soli TaxID=1500254 RepID=A0A0U5AUD0_9BACL|nr:type II secretion system protein [Aneurinibacillus soli]PYE63702.1 prepilin-type N-terminal cleavage/methylation domain-containing protein [Aneurinibacillus soli]BAU27365.1 Fimbrial protein precursor [Aneurinibacillus soli]